MTNIDIIGAVLISVVLSLFILTPLMRFLATKVNVMDYPSGKKVHTRPMPLLGGLAIYFAFFTAISLTLHADKILVGILVGGTVLMVVGIIDDKFGLMPRVKLFGQFIAALITVLMGVQVVFVKAPIVSMIFTCIWLVVMTNAFNLLDNINGLCAGISAISALFFGILALMNGDMMIAAVSFALMGSCLGFLWHNFPKARIFMGDAGSMFLGYVLASIAVAGSWKTSSVTTSLAIPILILGYPAFDITLVTINRLVEGRPISKGGKDHSSHRFATAIMESIRGSRDKKARHVNTYKILGQAIVEFMKGLKKKGEDRAMNRLAILGLKKKRAVLILCVMSFILGSAALAMTVFGKYFDWAIMIISFILLVLFGVRLGKIKVKD
jgi:UDP-GlcNAc:undecaprenyl-phosphate GlcNAc-1-phosphate transferase